MTNPEEKRSLEDEQDFAEEHTRPTFDDEQDDVPGVHSSDDEATSDRSRTGINEEPTKPL
jgi:hypothetical protein